MDTEKKKGSILPVLLTVVILILLFGAALFVLYKKGYLSFDKDNDDVTITDNCINETATTKDDSMKDSIWWQSTAKTNMTNDEVFDLWNKIKGNWAKIEFIGDLCSGMSLEINTHVQLAKFNSDGIITYSILSFNKVRDNVFELNLVAPVNLNDQMSGDIVARFSKILIDMDKPGDGKMKVSWNDDNWVEYEYAGEIKTIVSKDTNFYYIDKGYSQEEYCNWYKNNH